MTIEAVRTVQPLLPNEALLPGGGTSKADVSGATSFADVFAKTVQEASQADSVATTKVDALARGASDDLHGTMIAVKEADISIKLVGTFRNKLLDAFTELWRTSV